ncbi:hypothetical protein SARC_05111 [Sphaeroforma arctica JP610]|uniref:DUF2062 domain-containing protein n=1 Tax=Sphaeroforma arctica JP610 TaxID=667725 RepID=A0A0L0G1C3_9EUKA|nr:hypothetical protein SARC_05111 [Sphaeroforma arctica JP610]KNC82614.1 hypothetical protein SARC_05111 [Sphaeroforma arctica JP610]|eukprot:XP_014156516.1 hypothetical protein SARC_05111 [Sphaeroforma arctica JP610]
MSDKHLVEDDDFPEEVEFQGGEDNAFRDSQPPKNCCAKMVDDVKNVIQDGITPKKLALSVAFGISCGLFPIPGATALACLLASFMFGLNKIIIQVINLLLTAVEIICIPLFAKFGYFVLRQTPLDINISEIVDQLKEDFFATLGKFAGYFGCAVFGWLLLLIPISAIVFAISYPIFWHTLPKLQRKYAQFVDEDEDALEDDAIASGEEWGTDTESGTNEHNDGLRVVGDGNVAPDGAFAVDVDADISNEATIR